MERRTAIAAIESFLRNFFQWLSSVKIRKYNLMERGRCPQPTARW
ncbi:hypothetical protein CKA32_002994 [Geitlerinema sp. FC II]|nr:hypothetical protein CKA32_002994 [Geitlerinema sp. FC II]